MLKRKNRAFALLAVLALISVLTLLLGALIAGNQTSFSLLKRGYASDRIDRTHNSVFALCQQKLELDYTWGKEFAGQAYTTANLTVAEESGSGDTQFLRGTDTANQTEFEVRVCNNLTGRVALLGDLENGLKSGVPSGFCRLRILAKVDGQARTVEVLVRNPGLVSSSLLANGDLQIGAQSLVLNSKDPVKNQARAMGDVKFTGVPNFLFEDRMDKEAEKKWAEEQIRDDNPMIWAGGESLYRDSFYHQFESRENYKESHSSKSFQEERVKDQARSKFEVPEIEMSDLAEVRGPEDSSKETHEIPPGIYEFQQFTYEGSQVRVMVRRESNEAQGSPRDSQGPIERFWYMSDAEAGTGAYPSIDTVAARIGAGSAPGSDHKGQKYAEIGVEGAQVDFLQRRLLLDDQYNYEVRGDFALRAASTGDGSEETYGIKPSLFFANPELLPDSTAMLSTSTEIAESDDTNRGDLRCDGRVHVEGDIIGSATIAGGGDVTLAPSRFNDEKGDSEVDFSVYSGGDVQIIPPRLWELNDNRDSDYDESRSNISQNDLLFTGLIYAKGSVYMDLRDTDFQVQPRNFKVEGAVVALGGALCIANAEHLEVTYNPQFVDRLVPGFFKDNQNRIEVIGWRNFP